MPKFPEAGQRTDFNDLHPELQERINKIIVILNITDKDQIRLLKLACINLIVKTRILDLDEQIKYERNRNA